jgi:hypothetical protein
MEQNLNEGDLNFLIAELYSRIPKNTCENKILPYTENTEDLDDGVFVFMFEMLLNIYTEGLCHFDKLKIILEKSYQKEPIDNEMFKELIFNNMYDDIDFDLINEQSLLLSESWMKSIGFLVNVVEEDYDWYLKCISDDDINNNYHMGNHYCKVLLKSNPKDEPYFLYKNIDLPYHFIGNANFKTSKIKSINDVYAILIKNNKNNTKENKVYKISFREIKN